MEMFYDHKKFSDSYFYKLQDCLEMDDDELLIAQDEGWRKIQNFYYTNGSPNDKWGHEST